MSDQTPNRECERCGTTFRCGAHEGECWCFAVEVPKPALADIENLYADCLCEGCLKAHASADVATTENEEEKKQIP